jgi:ubiquinone/menaquinone biosynthesis C-methylase UbiE
MASVITNPSNAYQGVAAAWANGPAVMYDTLASAAIAGVAGEFRGASVLDVGAGTGALCRALRVAGAIPFAVDTSVDMLREVGDSTVLAIAGDMCALPFADCCFDAAVSGFAISHIDAPEDALIEMRRVVRGRGRVIAAVFGEAEDRVSKDVVDEVARQFGYHPPDWYVHLKTRTEPRSNTPALLRSCAEAARLEDIRIDDLTLFSGLTTPEAIVAYRTGLAHLAPFVDSLPASRRAALFDRAVAAVRERGQAVWPRVLVLSSRVPA